MPEITVILPTYNEAENIGDMVAGVDAALDGRDAEILVVDDDSPDGTSDVVEKIRDRFSRLRLLRRTADRGLVASIRDGIADSRGDVCIWMDADLSMPAAKIRELLAAIDDGADMAVGSRYVQGGSFKGARPNGEPTKLLHVWRELRSTEDSFFAVAVSKIGNSVVRWLLDRRFYDYTSGFYAVRKSVLAELPLEGRYLEYCISLLFNAATKGYRITEIPVSITPRIRGESKTSGTIVSILPIMLDCFRLVFRLRVMSRNGRSGDGAV